MKIAVLNIGNELLKGSIFNTNLAFIGNELVKIGNPPVLQITVNDNKQDIINAIKFIEDQNIDVIISSGGLGPTTDDITVETFANYFNIKLYTDTNVLKHIKTIIGSDNEISSHNKKQALIPEQSAILVNENGTAPGIKFLANNKVIFLLPGPPFELNPIFTKEVITYLAPLTKNKTNFESVYVVGIPESELQNIIMKNFLISDDLYIAYRAEVGGCEISFSSASQSLVAKYANKLKSILGSAVIEQNCKNIVEDIVIHLKNQNLCLGIAESCTGGMISSKITDISGASAVFKGSIVAYSNELKEKLLNVKNTTLARHGAVSAECALEMAQGCCQILETTASIAITGIAGPKGGSLEKPVGLVFIAVKARAKTTVNSYVIKGDRVRIRAKACAYAFNDLRNLIIKLPGYRTKTGC